MGCPKQLLALGHKPVIRHCLDNIIAAGVQHIVVVLGAESDGTVAALQGFPVTIVVNKKTGSEMAESVRIGLRAFENHSSGVLICLGDHPLASAETMRAVALAHRESPDDIIIPAYKGRRGHPSLFPCALLEDIFSGGTLRNIIDKYSRRVRIIEVPDEGVILDMDTPEDYENIVKRVVFRGEQ
jgi:molybdenum cofactor cytidylyltransferase